MAITFSSTCAWANKLCQFLHEAKPDQNSGIPSHVASNGISESELGALVHDLEPSEGEYKDLTDSVGYAYVVPDWMEAVSTIEEQADWAD